jgi:hypothetical protein
MSYQTHLGEGEERKWGGCTAIQKPALAYSKKRTVSFFSQCEKGKNT